MAKRITTLFIRDNSISVLVVDGQRIDKFASTPLDSGLVNQGLVVDDNRVAAAIRTLMRENQVRAGKVIVGVSGANSLYRMITLPEMPDALLAEAVRREAKRVLPVSLDDLYLSYQEVTPVNRGEKRLFLASYPKNVTDMIVKTVRAAGLTPYLMDLAPLALARVPDQPRSIIVNARGSHADIVVIEDRLPQLIRVLSLPAEATSFADKLPGIAEELGRTVIFYNSSHTEKPLNPDVPLYVCGELAENQDSWPRLVGRLNFPVSVLPSPLEAPEGFPVNEYVVNIGLALKEFGTDKEGSNVSVINLNILPETFHPKKVPVSAVLVPVCAVIGLGILAYMATFVVRGSQDTEKLRKDVAASQPPIAAQTQKIAQLKAEVNKVTPQAAPLEQQAAQIRATAGVFTSTMSGLEANRVKVDGDLTGKIVGLLPFNKNNLGLTSVGHDGKTIVVTGTAADESYVFDYARKLRQAGGIAAVVVNSVQANIAEDGTVTYAYNLLVK